MDQDIGDVQIKEYGCNKESAKKCRGEKNPRLSMNFWAFPPAFLQSTFDTGKNAKHLIMCKCLYIYKFMHTHLILMYCLHA